MSSAPRPTASSCPPGWSRDTRDDIIYPTKGTLQSALGEWGLPPGDLSYYKLNYLIQNFWPIYGDFVLMLRGDVGYGDGYGGKPLPFFKAFYAGGVGSVRGYDTGIAGAEGHLRQRDRGQAQDRRQRRALLPGPERRQVGARQRLLRCGPDLRQRQHRAALRIVPLLGRRRRSPGTRRSARSSSATASR